MNDAAEPGVLIDVVPCRNQRWYRLLVFYEILDRHVIDVYDSSFSDLQSFSAIQNHFPLPIIEVAPVSPEGGRDEVV